MLSGDTSGSVLVDPVFDSIASGVVTPDPVLLIVPVFDSIASGDEVISIMSVVPALVSMISGGGVIEAVFVTIS